MTLFSIQEKTEVKFLHLRIKQSRSKKSSVICCNVYESSTTFFYLYVVVGNKSCYAFSYESHNLHTVFIWYHHH